MMSKSRENYKFCFQEIDRYIEFAVSLWKLCTWLFSTLHYRSENEPSGLIVFENRNGAVMLRTALLRLVSLLIVAQLHDDSIIASTASSSPSRIVRYHYRPHTEANLFSLDAYLNQSANRGSGDVHVQCLPVLEYWMETTGSDGWNNVLDRYVTIDCVSLLAA